MLDLVKKFLGSDFSGNGKYLPVDPELLKMYNRQRSTNKKALCLAPFTNLYFGRKGNVVSCCHNREHIIGNYPQQSIGQIWNGEKLKELRDYLKHNDLSSGCHVCKWDMEQKNFKEVKALHFDSLPVFANFPSMMEFELDNTCNLECAMCSGEFSSTIRKNRECKPPIVSVYDNEFVEQLQPFIPHLKETRFSGGEPFLIDIYYKIWKKINKENPQCLISVQTNGTVLNGRIKEIMEAGSFEIGVSIDSLEKDVYERIRKHARFETVMENVKYFADYCKRKNTNFRISVCAMRENWRELPAYIDFCRQHSALLQIHTVWFPPGSALWNLEEDKLNEISGFLSTYKFNEKEVALDPNYAHYKSFSAQVKHWALGAVNRSNNVVHNFESTSAAKQELLNRLESHVMSDKVLPQAMKEKNRDAILDKAKNVFDRFEDNEHSTKGFVKMIEVPVEIVVSVLQVENEERIYDYMTLMFVSN